MEQPAPVIEALDARGDGLRVTFFWRVDRYAHRIERIEAGSSVPLLESLEGSDLDCWPASPPLQQLSMESLPDGRAVALLVGMAGSSHWSLTVERDPSDASLLFDAACRVKAPAETLGSAYRSFVRHELSRGAGLLHRPGGTGHPAAVELVVLDGAAPPRLETDVRGLHIRMPAEIAPPATVRWKYRMKIARR
jgi:hypothetical protein